MREIKFRAWDTLNNKYFENTYEAYKGDLEILQIGLNGRLQLITSLERRDESLFPDRFIIQQYTGLKDRNGTEIYEGDVLKRGDFPDEKPEFIVRFGQFTDSPDFYHELEYSGWYVERIGERDKYNTSLVYVIEMLDGIVCGNIYEGDNQ